MYQICKICVSFDIKYIIIIIIIIIIIVVLLCKYLCIVQMK